MKKATSKLTFWGSVLLITSGHGCAACGAGWADGSDAPGTPADAAASGGNGASSSSTQDAGDAGSKDSGTYTLDRCAIIKASISEAGFAGEVSVTCDGTRAHLASDTYPDHDVMNGITGTNEQVPVPAKDYVSPIPLQPRRASQITTIDAALGVAVNGVPIYDYSSQGELDVSQYDPKADTLLTGQLDLCGGHAGRGDDYHYHAAPTCMIEAM